MSERVLFVLCARFADAAERQTTTNNNKGCCCCKYTRQLRQCNAGRDYDDADEISAATILRIPNRRRRLVWPLVGSLRSPICSNRFVFAPKPKHKRTAAAATTTNNNIQVHRQAIGRGTHIVEPLQCCSPATKTVRSSPEPHHRNQFTAGVAYYCRVRPTEEGTRQADTAAPVPSRPAARASEVLRDLAGSVACRSSSADNIERRRHRFGRDNLSHMVCQ
jgi:hypothetical protein